jgi:hypothetical protein
MSTSKKINDVASICDGAVRQTATPNETDARPRIYQDSLVFADQDQAKEIAASYVKRERPAASIESRG